MDALLSTLDIRQIGALLRGEPGQVGMWVRRWSSRRLLLYGAVIVVGAGCYGAAMGSWRALLQAVYNGMKFPLVILLTTLGNGLLNGMLAPLLGLNIGFRQSLLVVSMSFTIASAILGSFSPLMLFLIWNTPPVTGSWSAVSSAYCFMQLATVVMIAFAGVVGNLKLVPLLRELSGSSAVAWRVLFAWLAVNLLLGSQLCWNLRPFIGDPKIPVEFFSTHAFEGNFFEAVFKAAKHFLN
ncbi:MAG TPA: hypothetical protein VN281_16370 [Verrucomicrobiae bacterium]|nr:hypothetical protein [Verrucomicrobiae bacterium]